MKVFYMKYKKYNQIQLTKNKMDSNNQIMKDHSPSPKKSLLKPNKI